MSKRAEQAALIAYPPEMIYGESTLDGKYDGNATPRYYYIKGYEQAEKDIALTWQDVAKLDAIILDVNNEFAVDYSKEISRQKFYEEVLRRFNEIRKK